METHSVSVLNHPPSDVNSSTTPKKRILLVDDDQNVSYMVGHLLRGVINKFEVIYACSGLDALEIIKANPSTIDLIFLDYIMPGMDGEETFYEIRYLDKTVPIIMISGITTEPAERLIAGDKGLNGYLKKPILPKALREILREVVPEWLSQTAARQ